MKKIILFLITVFLAYLTAYQTTGKKNGYPSPFNFTWIDSLNLSSNTTEPVLEDYPDYALINDDMQEGYEQFLKKDYDNAIEYFYDASFDSASAAKANLMMGRCYMAKNDPDNAKYYLDVAAEFAPKDSEIYFYRGKLNYESGNSKEAINDLYLATELGCEKPEALYLLSLAYENENNNEASLQAALQALEKDSLHSDALYQAGRMCFASEKYTEAVKFYNRAIEQKPNDKYSILNRSLAYDNLDIKDSAIIGYNRVIEIDPEYALAYNNRGWVFHQLEDYKSAMSDYNKALEIDPTYELPLWNRASLYFDNNEPEKALADYLELYNLNMNNHKALYYAALCYEQIGVSQSALEYFQVFLNSGSDDYELLDKAREKIKKYE